MPQQYIALNLPLEEDLLPLTALLRTHGLPHLIYEEGGHQVLAVFDPGHVLPVRELYRAWRAGEVSISLQKREGSSLPDRLQWRRAPVTAMIAAFCVLVYGLTVLFPETVLPLLNFLPFELVGRTEVFGHMGAQYWRLLTPVFLHFGLLHIAFNLLWFWELGSRVEAAVGRLNFLGIFLVIALVSNFSQFAVSGPSIFGGMSGVVYGVLGFSAVAPWIQPAWQIRPYTPVLLFMIGWLFVCMTGVLGALGFGAIANAAHVGGLVCGAVLGVIFASLSRASRAG